MQNDQEIQKKNTLNLNKNEDIKNKSTTENKNLRKKSETESDKIKDFLKKDSFKQIEPKPKRDFSDKLKDELNQLKELTKEADYIITEKKEKVNEAKEAKRTENREEVEGKKNKSDEKNKDVKNTIEESRVKVSDGNKISRETILFETEFEEKLSYLIDKLDIINKITK